MEFMTIHALRGRKIDCQMVLIDKENKNIDLRDSLVTFTVKDVSKAVLFQKTSKNTSEIATIDPGVGLITVRIRAEELENAKGNLTFDVKVKKGKKSNIVIKGDIILNEE